MLTESGSLQKVRVLWDRSRFVERADEVAYKLELSDQLQGDSQHHISNLRKCSEELEMAILMQGIEVSRIVRSQTKEQRGQLGEGTMEIP
ncbi:hypothetical protein OSB04_028186 [Centaurea solstitialis]|uniref:Uncharacterized protein n=1 Tax=Centaurea solstitialis TaxID=347529 RepID=A0AA38SF83_9ASTR|nr:hypothetical protein OSB04_028186 [Centaurea solstitialis]